MAGVSIHYTFRDYNGLVFMDAEAVARLERLLRYNNCVIPPNLPKGWRKRMKILLLSRSRWVRDNCEINEYRVRPGRSVNQCAFRLWASRVRPAKGVPDGQRITLQIGP